MILAKFHMLETDRLDLQCSVCFQPNYELLQCQGPCQKLLCKTCSRRFVYRVCPYCSVDCYIDYLPPKKAMFRCPAECPAELNSQKAFQQHCRSCENLPKELQQQYIYKSEYKCSKGHRLNFPLYKTNCTFCTEYHYTSECDQCGVRLCTNCRPPPCSKQQCPLGHNFEHNSHGGSVICDLCGISLSAMATRHVYGDRSCNFDICLACHSKLPETHPQPNYREEKEAYSQTIQGQNIRVRPQAGAPYNLWNFRRVNSNPPSDLEQEILRTEQQPDTLQQQALPREEEEEQSDEEGDIYS